MLRLVKILVSPSLVKFEHDLIRERTQAGLSAARARGRKGGMPRGLLKTSEATACAVETCTGLN